MDLPSPEGGFRCSEGDPGDCKHSSPQGLQLEVQRSQQVPSGKQDTVPPPNPKRLEFN